MPTLIRRSRWCPRPLIGSPLVHVRLIGGCFHRELFGGPNSQYPHVLSLLRNSALLFGLLVLLQVPALPREQNKHVPVPRVERDNGWAQQTLKSLSVEEKVGQ